MRDTVKVVVEIEVYRTTEDEVATLAGRALMEVKHKLRTALTDPYGSAFVAPPVLKIGTKTI